MIPGNTSTIAFVNCLTAATEALRRNSCELGAKFDKVHVIHTRESLVTFAASSDANHLQEIGLHQGDLVHHVVDMVHDSDDRLVELLSGVADITSSRTDYEFYFDLTGGITHIKVALGILAFLLGAKHVYTLEIDFETREQRKLSLKCLRAENLQIEHRQIAGLEQFDLFGLSNLTEVKRVRTELNELQQLGVISLRGRPVRNVSPEDWTDPTHPVHHPSRPAPQSLPRCP